MKDCIPIEDLFFLRLITSRHVNVSLFEFDEVYTLKDAVYLHLFLEERDRIEQDYYAGLR